MNWLGWVKLDLKSCSFSSLTWKCKKLWQILVWKYSETTTTVWEIPMTRVFAAPSLRHRTPRWQQWDCGCGLLFSHFPTRRSQQVARLTKSRPALSAVLLGSDGLNVSADNVVSRCFCRPNFDVAWYVQIKNLFLSWADAEVASVVSSVAEGLPLNSNVSFYHININSCNEAAQFIILLQALIFESINIWQIYGLRNNRLAKLFCFSLSQKCGLRCCSFRAVRRWHVGCEGVEQHL